MRQPLLKSLALKAVSLKMGIPEAGLDRVTELIHLKALLSLMHINCVLDVGANRGQFAHELRAIGFRGLIVSFEPVESEYLALQSRFTDDRAWIGRQLALGSAAASLTMRVPKLTVMSSLLEPVAAESDTRTETVAVQRLDAVLPAIVAAIEQPRVFLKMDTQGYDLEVFKGASACLDLVFGLQSELSVQPLYRAMPHYLEALALYEGSGFDLYNLSVVNRVADGGLLELNCFMKRPAACGA
ncbi:MAG: FkbM family methyltransferase [Pseudomonadota bacterium]